MLASSSSRRFRLLAVAALGAFAALVAAGCTVPGSSRLQGPPEQLPPSLHYVTADVFGFTLFDTANADLDELELPDDRDEWIGDSAGVAIRELQLDADEPPATLTFADVEDPDALRRALESAGWIVAEDTGQEGLPTQWERRSGLRRAMATYDDALIMAQSREELERWVRMADEYAVPERRAMSEYAVEARDLVPQSFVFRFDLLRTQLRRPFQHDPALLEFARWATDSNMLVALRDGWVGIAPPQGGSREGVRIVGASEWVPDLAAGIELKPASRDTLDELRPDLRWAVALHDPGQHLRELVRAITIGAGQYATGQDTAEREKVELLPVLDDLDGQAAIGGSGRYVEAFVEGGDAGDLQQVFETAGLDGSVEADDGAVRVEIGRRPSASGDRIARRFVAGDAAGSPPRPPVAWLWKAGGSCVGPAAGWVTFDGTDELRLSIAVDPAAAGEACPDGLAKATLESLGVRLLTEQPRPSPMKR